MSDTYYSRGSNLLNIPSERKKQCSKCKELKSYDDFHKNLARNDQLGSICKPCKKEEAHKYHHRKDRERNGQVVSRERLLRVKYNLTMEEYEELVSKQDNKCAICEREEISIYQGKLKPLAVDHDHKTGKIRELLCCKCNFCLGGVDDNIEILEKAIEYLKKHKN
jgi:Autographiviridae endonuclease VII